MAIRVVSEKPDENGRLKLKISADGRRYSVWVLPTAIVRNPLTGGYDRVLVGPPVERLVRIFVDDALISETMEMIPQTYIVAINPVVKTSASVAA